METKLNKRGSRRTRIETPIVCSYLTTGDNNKTFDGKMLNYGPCGMYAELSDRFKNGTILLIKTKRCPTVQFEMDLAEGFRTISLAQVKWTKRISSNGETRYGTGLQYF